jgi:hypothetical protein
MQQLIIGLLFLVVIKMVELLVMGGACYAGVLLSILIVFYLHSSCCYVRSVLGILLIAM